jgi:hypothetical protein
MHSAVLFRDTYGTKIIILQSYLHSCTTSNLQNHGQQEYPNPHSILIGQKTYPTLDQGWFCAVLDKGKGKVDPRTGHEGPNGEYRHNSTLSLTSALDRVVVNATPRPIYPRERAGTHCTGGWVSPRTGLYGCGKSRLHRDLIPGPSRQ